MKCYKKMIVAMVFLISGSMIAAEDDSNTPIHESETRAYKIAQTYPFPPWDTGPLEGVSMDVLRAICEANAPMRCRFEAMASEACFDSDGDGNPVIGEALANGNVDGCLTWFHTTSREQLGAEFGHGYSRGSTPQLIATIDNTEFENLSDTGSLNSAKVAFFAGFFSDAACLAGRYADFNTVLVSSEAEGRAEALQALSDGEIDLLFWDNTSTVPEGTQLVGAPVRACSPEDLGLAVYPPSRARPHHSDHLRRDYNCGLALIRQNGVLADICEQSSHPGGDPACMLEGPPPTEQCLADNPVSSEEEEA